MMIVDLVEESYFAMNGVVVGKLLQTSNECMQKGYTIQIAWNKWEQAGKPSVSGIDDTLRKDIYVREYPPYLLTQRTLDPRRKDIPDLLEREGIPFFEPFDYMCWHFGTSADDDAVFVRGITYRIIHEQDVDLHCTVPLELQREIPVTATLPMWKKNFDVLVTGGYNLQRAAQQGFSSWLSTIHQIDDDLGLKHPYLFNDKLWRG